MTDAKRAFVLMPFKEPYNSYYPTIFKPALEAAGYSVKRADDLYAPHPIMLDVQNSILEADLILCEMSERNPNVFYELGLAHAIGRPSVLVSRNEEDIPFDLRAVRVILYDYRQAGWEAKLKEAITKAADAVRNLRDIWPPPLVGSQDKRVSLRGLASEITFNLAEIDKFFSHAYSIDEAGNVTTEGKPATLRYITCMTNQFEGSSTQSGLQSLDDKVRRDVFEVYHAFREINNRADALKQAFRPWRAKQYFEAINEFQARNRSAAERLVQDL